MRTVELLDTKLQRPRIPPHYVPRSRLIERLDQGAQQPLTLVCAAAGYGKTTLVSSWIEGFAAGTGAATTPLPVAWISLDERDSDLGLFLRYFIAALRTIFPNACAATSNLVRAPRQPSFDLLCTTLSNELAHLPQDFILVLDDHHAIGGTAVPDFLHELARHWPQPLHLVLISRHVPALSLAALRAKGQLTEIRTADLRFTPDETAAFLAQSLRTPLSKSTVELLERQSEGWIAALQLAALYLREAGDPEALLASLSGSDAEFVEYLADDVLSQQPAPVLSFMYQTAILDHFRMALCEAVVEVEDPAWSVRRCVDWLERRNLFLIPLDSHKEWYRYHHMFRSMLLKRLSEELEHRRITGLQRSAAAWFAEQGLIEEALRYALAADDLDLAAQFVNQGLCDVLNREDRPTLERWLGLFRREFIQNRADLLIVKAVSQNIASQLNPMSQTVQRAAVLLEAADRGTLVEAESKIWHGLLALMSAAVAYFVNDLAGAVGWSDDALALLPEAWSFARGATRIYQSLAMQAAGQGPEAVRLLIHNLEGYGDRPGYTLRLLLALGGLYYAQAEDLQKVVQTAQRLLEGAERSELRIVQSWGLCLLGLAHYQRNDLAAARPCLARLLDYKYSGNITAVHDGLRHLVLVHHIMGEQAEAWRMLQILVQFDLELIGHEADETHALRAQLWLLSGNLASAAAWADSFTAPVAVRGWPVHDPPHLIKAQVLVARGTAVDVQSALEILNELVDIADRSHNVRLHIPVLALRALALGTQGQAGEAGDSLRSLQEAIDLARSGGFLRVFLDLGPRMRELLSRLPKRDVMVRRILAEFDDQATSAATGREEEKPLDQVVAAGPTSAAHHGHQPLIEPLTPRELEILGLLREPISLKELALRLYISYHTARRHTINIYGKLDVNQRWDAVSKAEALGILPRR
jgi:LuxR family transcriptional regulator, maltose regulon positive regulatory protein